MMSSSTAHSVQSRAISRRKCKKAQYLKPAEFYDDLIDKVPPYVHMICALTIID